MWGVEGSLLFMSNCSKSFGLTILVVVDEHALFRSSMVPYYDYIDLSYMVVDGHFNYYSSLFSSLF